MRQKAEKSGAGEVCWPKIVLKKWFNIRTTSFNYDREIDSVVEDDSNEGIHSCEVDEDKREFEAGPKLRRRNSETLRAQYVKNNEIRIRIGTWNIGGISPPDELNMEDWLNMEEAADIYAIGMQEIVPLNAGNVFGVEDRQRVPKWEYLIRDTLNRIPPAKRMYKCYSDPPSPSRFEPTEDAAVKFDELLFEGDTDTDEEAEHLETDATEKDPTSSSSRNDDLSIEKETKEQKQVPSKRLERLHQFSLVDYDVDSEVTANQERRFPKSFKKSGLVWPEQPLNLNASRSTKDFRMLNSFKQAHDDVKSSSKIDLSIRRCRSRRSTYVRIISKQMVGLYLSIWVRRSLRRHIQNLQVSIVGVGAMGYIGNKGSISVSMSVYQTFFCFVCSHLFAGEKSGDELRRNADVQEIHQKTQFSTASGTRLPKTIYEHDRVFWLGDLNYRIDLSYEKIHELISENEWLTLAGKDQLKQELEKDHVFHGWSEGVMNFPPTYKYEFNSTKYIGDDKKGGRRRPAWCDRILFFGRGIRVLEYGRAEINLSDHRPVCGTFLVEVEEICHRKLQKVLSLTDAATQSDETSRSP